jgi:hypothetical protein
VLSKEEDRIRQRKRRAAWTLEDKKRATVRNREWRRDNPGAAKAITDRYRQSRRKFLEECKAVPCADCGLRYPSYVMDFDHRTPGEKSFSVSEGYRLNMDRLKEEIAKCDVICANCHRERTHRQGF